MPASCWTARNASRVGMQTHSHASRVALNDGQKTGLVIRRSWLRTFQGYGRVEGCGRRQLESPAVRRTLGEGRPSGWSKTVTSRLTPMIMLLMRCRGPMGAAQPPRSFCAPCSAMLLASPWGPTSTSPDRGNGGRQPVTTVAFRRARHSPVRHCATVSESKDLHPTSCPRISGRPRLQMEGLPDEADSRGP